MHAKRDGLRRAGPRSGIEAKLCRNATVCACPIAITLAAYGRLQNGLARFYFSDMTFTIFHRSKRENGAESI